MLDFEIYEWDTNIGPRSKRTEELKQSLPAS